MLVLTKQKRTTHHNAENKIYGESYLVLTSNIPDGEANVLVLNSFNIETCISQRSIL
jgi:hypothetical protein